MRRTLSLALLTIIAVTAHAQLTLPYSGTDPTATLSSFQITKSGTAGRANTLYITHASNTSDVLLVNTIGLGRAAYFSINNAANSQMAVRGDSNGSGIGVFGFMTGSGRAGMFRISNPANSNSALHALTNGSGAALRAEAGTGLAGDFVGMLRTTGFTLTTGALNGRVLKSNSTGVGTWQFDGLTLPFSSSSNVASPNTVLRITNNSTGYGILGQSNGSGGIGVFGVANSASGFSHGVWGQNNSTGGSGVYGYSGASSGQTFGGYFASTSNNGYGVYGTGPAFGAYFLADGPSGRGVQGTATNSSGLSFGVTGTTASTEGRGVWGSANASSGDTYGVYGESQSSFGKGVFGYASAASGSTIGVRGESASPSGYGVHGAASAQSGTNYGGYFQSNGPTGMGVFGTASGGGENYGVYGRTNSPSGIGVFGYATPSSGGNFGGYFTTNSPDGQGAHCVAIASSGLNYGVVGETLSSGGYGVYSLGRTGVSGTKSFRIDHPFDPENQYLQHYCSEGPEPMNQYSGNVTTDSQGVAWVQLPDYFGEINKDFRYTLTIVDEGDDFVQAKVWRKIRENRFAIRTSKGQVQVSWEVKGVRNDLFVRKYGAPVEVNKEGKERGKYQHPELYGKPRERAMSYRAEAVEPQTQKARRP